MSKIDRIAALLVIPVLALVGLLLVTATRDDDRTATVLGEGTERSTDDDPGPQDDPGADDSSGGADDGSTPDQTSPTTAEVAPATTTTTAAADRPAVDDRDPQGAEGGATSEAAQALAPADPAASPVEPFGVYKDGRLVLRGSVPDADVAAGFVAKAGSVIGPDNVEAELTLDPRVAGTTMAIEVDEQFRFPAGAVTFDPEFESLLNLGIAALQLLPEATLVVTGHTDDVGSEGTNLALSVARAQVVVDFMVERGIDPGRIVARGAGESEPIADNATPEGRDINRRIEAVLEGVTPG